MPKRVAVAVIHGMGSQGDKRPAPRNKITFSKDLHKRVKKEIGKSIFESDVEWREIFWADVLQKREADFLKKIGRPADKKPIQKFVMFNLTDAASYRKVNDQNDQTYERIHRRVDETINDLAGEVEEGAPLIVLAHSLGGHIMSNYIYDLQKPGHAHPPSFQGLRTMAAFVTFGCNIPIFTFAYDEEDISPIEFPGTGLDPKHRRKTWWHNYFDRDDVLGFPLAPVSPDYKALKDSGALKDIRINAGGFFDSWNLLSHNAYWKDDDFYQPVAKLIKSFL